MSLSGNDTIAIFGQGPVGLAGTQFAKAMGARVIALDVNPQRLERAKEFGADEVVDPGSNDPVAAIKDLTHGRYADLSLDTSSNPEARLNAIRSTKVWGTMCFVGEGGDVKIDVSPHLLRRQMTLIASWTFSNDHPGRVRDASVSSARSTWTSCSPTAGSWSRRRRRTSCSTSRRTARACS